MWGLDGHIGSPPDDELCDHWQVSVNELSRRLRKKVKTLAEAEGAVQSVVPAGRLINAVFHEYEAAPKVDFRLDLLPNDASQIWNSGFFDYEFL